MKSLLVMIVAVVIAISFSVVSFAVEQNAVGSQQTTTKESVKMETATTGNVTSIDPQGTAITDIGEDQPARRRWMWERRIVKVKDTIVKVGGEGSRTQRHQGGRHRDDPLSQI